MIPLYTLLLRLGGPMQSWGSGSLYNTRDTDYFPTKSGVIGMIASALGRKRDEPVDDLSALSFGVRVDHQGEIVTDFQVTDMGEKLESNLSYRKYLCDALFLIGLASQDLNYLKHLETALKNPKYPLFLGRRSCPPTYPLVLGIKEKELSSALQEEDWLMPEWRRKKTFGYKDTLYLRIIVDDPGTGSLKKDLPKSFSPFSRQYEYRMVSELKPKAVVKKSGITATEHDAMSELG